MNFTHPEEEGRAGQGERASNFFLFHRLMNRGHALR